MSQSGLYTADIYVPCMRGCDLWRLRLSGSVYGTHHNIAWFDILMNDFGSSVFVQVTNDVTNLSGDFDFFRNGQALERVERNKSHSNSKVSHNSMFGTVTENITENSKKCTYSLLSENNFFKVVTLDVSEDNVQERRLK